MSSSVNRSGKNSSARWPGVDDDAGARRNVVAEELRVLHRLTGQEWQWRVQSERLLDHAPEVAQLVEVVLGDDVVAAAGDGRSDLVLDPRISCGWLMSSAMAHTSVV